MRPSVITSLTLAACATTTPAGELLPLGPDFVVSSANTGSGQGYVWGDCDDDGNFVVGFATNQIFARRFDRDGVPQETDQAVNPTVWPGDQNETFVASDPLSGDYLVCYSDRGGNDGALIGVGGRFYKADGTPYGGEFFLNANTAASQFEPHAAYMPNGRVMVVWSDDDPSVDGSVGCIGRIFDRFGNALTNEFLINQASTKTQIDPSVAASRDGRFVVAFVDASGDTGPPREVLARLFDQNGNALGPQFLVNSASAGEQRDPIVAMDADGDFVVVWQDESGADGDGVGVFARLFDANGTAKSSQFVVAQTTTGTQRNPYIDIDFVGNFVVTWESDHSGDWDVYLRRFDRHGSALSAETLVHESPTGDQNFAKTIVSQSGQRYLSMWIDADSLAHARLFEAPVITATGSPTIGSVVTLDLDFPGMGGANYVVLPSLGTAPGIDINGARILDLAMDELMLQAAAAPDAAPFFNLAGTLDGSGHAQATFTVPNDSALFGENVYFAGLTLGSGSLDLGELAAGSLTGVDVLSDPFIVTIGDPDRVLAGQILQGEIEAAAEEDRALIEGLKGETLKIEVLPIDPNSQPGVKLGKFTLEVFDDAGDLLAVFKGKVPNAGKAGDKFKLKLKQNGTCYFHIRGKSSMVGQYRFAFTHKLPKSAKPTTKKVKIGSSGDAKLALLAAADATLDVTVKPLKGAPVPATVQILDANGVAIDTGSKLTVQGKTLVLAGLDLAATGGYTVRVPGPKGEKYEVQVTPVQPEDDDAVILP